MKYSALKLSIFIIAFCLPFAALGYDQNEMNAGETYCTSDHQCYECYRISEYPYKRCHLIYNESPYYSSYPNYPYYYYPAYSTGHFHDHEEHHEMGAEPQPQNVGAPPPSHGMGAPPPSHGMGGAGMGAAPTPAGHHK